MPKYPIKPGQLCIGRFVHLDLPWMKHSFMSSSFKIKNEKQLAELKRLGLTQIVSIVNAYENLCNQKDTDKSHSPYEAMSIFFARDKQKYNEDKLTTFITNMGVYPPRTVVRLSNDSVATVISINQNALLNPNIMVYDPQIPKSKALIIDLTEEDLKITGAYAAAACRRKSLIISISTIMLIFVLIANPEGNRTSYHFNCHVDELQVRGIAIVTVKGLI